MGEEAFTAISSSMVPMRKEGKRLGEALVLEAEAETDGAARGGVRRMVSGLRG